MSALVPPARLHEGATLDVVIEGVDDEGRGRATLPGAPGEETLDVAVRGALPGDVVTCKVERVWPARKLAQARPVHLTAASALRTPRACPHRAPCPGCPFEGVDAGFALAFKRARVEQALVDAGLADAARLVSDVEPSRGPRQKAKVVVGGAAGAVRFGLYVPHSHVLVDSDECPHVHPAILDALAVLGDALDELLLEPGALKAVVLRAFALPASASTDAARVGAVLVAHEDCSDDTWRALAACVDGAPLASLALRIERAAGDGASANSLVGGHIVRSVGPAQMAPLEGGPPASVDAFCQTDPALALEMYTRAARFLVDGTPPTNEPRTFVDAYAGAGGFARAIVAHERDARVVAVERADEGVRTLRTLPQVEALALSVEEALPELAKRHAARAFAGVVLDPPKSGLKDAAAPLAALGAPRVVLVACDPDAGARDVKIFVAAGYELAGVAPLDLFPATTEVETMFFLTRR